MQASQTSLSRKASDEGAASFVICEEAMGKLLADIAAASSSIVIAAPYASAKAIEALVEPLSDARRRGLDVVCAVAKQVSSEVRTAFAKTGLSLAEDESLACSGLAIFDHRLVWYGSVPLLAFPRADDCSIRFDSAEAAHDLLQGAGAGVRCE